MGKRIERLDEYEDLEGFLDLSILSYCGLYMRKDVAAKFLTIQKNAVREVKKMLLDNLDQLETSAWTLDYSTGKQESVHYYAEDESNDKEKHHRINLIDKIIGFDVRKHEAVYRFKDYKEAVSLMVKEEVEVD